MTTVLSISNKLLSLRGEIFINDEDGELLYEAYGEFKTLPSWTIKKKLKDVALIKRKFWAWSPTWNINSAIGSFAIKRKNFSWTRSYDVIDGPYDGASIKGNIRDSEVTVIHKAQKIASAQKKIFSLRDTHSIVLHDPNSELFTTIIMVTLLLDRKSDDDDSNDDKPDE